MFAAGEGFDPALTEGELACVPAWNEGVQIDAYELSGDGAARHLVVAHTLDGEGGEATRTAVLDENYRVLLGGLEEGRTAYTPEEYRYLTGARFENSYLARAEATGPQGGRYALLLRETYPTDAQYRQVLGGSVWVAALFLPLFLATAGLFIWRLRRRIARPGGAERRGGRPEPGRGPAGGQLRRPKGDSAASARALTTLPPGWPRARPSESGWTRAARSSSRTSPTTSRPRSRSSAARRTPSATARCPRKSASAPCG